VGELDGHRLLAEGREAEIYDWDDGQVLRLMRTPAQLEPMQRSTLAIAAAHDAGVRTAAVLEEVEVDGRPGQVMERLDGIDQFALAGRRPWTLLSSVRRLAAIHVDLHRVEVSEEFESVHDMVAAKLRDSPLVPAAVSDAALVALGELPAGSSLCHGDYHPGNVLVDGDDAVVIDWTNAARGHPMADFARTRLMLQVGELPPGSPALMRGLAVAGRAVFCRLYVRGYRSLGTLDIELADRWAPVRAADRLAEDVEGERETLLEVCRRGFGLADL
jgi:aminoglycoside phosphotransferase (APT) family kinase protein